MATADVCPSLSAYWDNVAIVQPRTDEQVDQLKRHTHRESIDISINGNGNGNYFCTEMESKNGI